MSKQTDYTPEEWKTISAAPVMAGLLISVSDLSGPIGMAKEVFAVVNGVASFSFQITGRLLSCMKVNADIFSPQRLLSVSYQ